MKKAILVLLVGLFWCNVGFAKEITLKKCFNTYVYDKFDKDEFEKFYFKIDTVKRYIKNNNKLDVKFPFFLNEIDLSVEHKFATR